MCVSYSLPSLFSQFSIFALVWNEYKIELCSKKKIKIKIFFLWTKVNLNKNRQKKWFYYYFVKILVLVNSHKFQINLNIHMIETCCTFIEWKSKNRKKKEIKQRLKEKVKWWIVKQNKTRIAWIIVYHWCDKRRKKDFKWWLLSHTNCFIWNSHTRSTLYTTFTVKKKEKEKAKIEKREWEETKRKKSQSKKWAVNETHPKRWANQFICVVVVGFFFICCL